MQGTDSKPPRVIPFDRKVLEKAQGIQVKKVASNGLTALVITKFENTEGFPRSFDDKTLIAKVKVKIPESEVPDNDQSDSSGSD